MSSEEKACLAMGQELLRMIRDLHSAARSDAGYSRREITFRGGAVILLLANKPELADLMEAAVDARYAVAETTPPSQLN